MVGPLALGQRQQLPGLPGKALLGDGGELGQVVVGDQRLASLGGFAGVCELMPLLGQALGVGRLEIQPRPLSNVHRTDLDELNQPVSTESRRIPKVYERRRPHPLNSPTPTPPKNEAPKHVNAFTF